MRARLLDWFAVGVLALACLALPVALSLAVGAMFAQAV